MNTELRGGYPLPFVSAEELSQAVANNFLSQDEARTVYWSQFDVLRRNAVAEAGSTPPALAAAA